MPNSLTDKMLARIPFQLTALARTSMLILSLALFAAVFAQAQNESSLEDNSADPMKLFDLGQNAHAHGDFERAITLYEEALKVRPEFPEAEFQRGNALVSLQRWDQAEAAYRKAIQLRATWASPQSALGLLLIRLNRLTEAETALRQALKLDPQDPTALRTLADLRLQSGDAKEALSLAKQATSAKDSPLRAWIVRATAERSLGDKAAAAISLDHVLQLDPNNQNALLERAELRIDNNDFPGAIRDLQAVEALGSVDKYIASRLAQDYDRTGKPDEGRRIVSSFQLITSRPTETSDSKAVIGSPEEIAAANSEDPAKSRQAMKALLEKNPGNAMLLSKLGNSYRTDDPSLSLEFYRRASQIEPKNVDYATGYAAALVQARNFSDAIRILRGVLALAPENYSAHANLATALYKQKLFAEAIAEYDWIIKTKPELGIAYYFIATAHDNLGEYPEALAAYEAFLTRADPQTNQLEIEKVKLRLPPLRHQIQLGQGVKHKTANK